MAADVVSMLAPWLDQEGARVEIAPDMPVVSCHPVYAAEVFKNLIGNAVKYNANPEKRIWVGWAAGAEGVYEFHVRDNGIGIPERHRESIFQIFKRLHGRDKFGGGSGAGLTITRKIVERHGGRIWVESVEGEGTTFHFTLANGEHAR
jgi:signal transduction histidine kinase